jgi:hypothetical protein
MAAAVLPDALWDLVEPFLPIPSLTLGCALVCWQFLRKTGG